MQVNTYLKNPYNIQAKNILFLGRLGERKGVYDLLNVVQRLDSQIDMEYKFYLCGDGDINGVKKRVDELHIAHRIAYIGWIDGEMKKEILVAISVAGVLFGLSVSLAAQEKLSLAQCREWH